MKGKLIVIEGTDCSGKETQSNKLVEYLNKNGIKSKKFAFPNYDSPTGKIIAGPYLGKDGYAEPVFTEGASNVDPYCSSLLFAMDRLYNIKPIIEAISEGYVCVLDRYVESNMAHQGAKLENNKQEEMFKFLEELEYGLLKLPRPDIQVLLHMPTWAAEILKKNRTEKPDQHESDTNHLLRAEETYLKLAARFKSKIIECTNNKEIKTIDQISSELCNYIQGII